MDLSLNDSSVISWRNATAFGSGWLVLEHAGGTPPSLASFPFAAAGLRNALAGMAPQLDVTQFAIVPLADVGAAHSSGSLQGVAIVLRSDFTDLPALVRTLEALLEHDGPTLRVPFGPLEWRLRRNESSRAPALEPERWLGFVAGGGTRSATRWASATPLMLGRPRQEITWSQREHALQRLIEDACTEVALPLPSRVFSSPVSPVRGTRPVPPHRRSRTLTHAVVEFDYPVPGPIILGHGRSLGLGLCLPMRA
ncbi:MAG: type I-U CRISPR-associated protein Csb2 [Candidatus Baltobacteraceae bacterium]